MAITITYSNALPVLRERLVRAVAALGSSATVREQAAAGARVAALAEAIEILGRSTDQIPVPGIADFDYLLPADVSAARDYFGVRADRLLGPPGTENGEPE